MRLICPNCGAQYAVAEGVIPSGGRDVQCSNCAHTWFETPGGSADDMPPPARKVTPPPTPEPKPAPAAPTDPYSGSINDAFKDVDEPTLAPAPQPPADRKPLDRSVADILREEAAIETAQRKSEITAPIESQSDLGLSDPAPAPPAPKPDPVAPAVATIAATTAASTDAASRKELLPDIEEINSSLRSDAERATSDDDGLDEIAAKRKGFRRGFLTVLLILMVFVLVYAYADQIAAAVPALADALKGYVDTVDIWRIWLDDNVQAMLLSIAAE